MQQQCSAKLHLLGTDMSFNATRSGVCVNVLLVCWTRSHHARLGKHNHPNYTNYISFWIAQQDFRVSRLSFSPSLSHWLWSGGTDVRGREVAMEMGATVAFQEDGSWQKEAKHQQWLRIRQVKYPDGIYASIQAIHRCIPYAHFPNYSWKILQHVHHLQPLKYLLGFNHYIVNTVSFNFWLFAVQHREAWATETCLW